MEEFISEPGNSDSPSPISEPPDITNWFSSYVYESLPLSSSVKESESELNGFSVREDRDNLGVSNHKPTNKSLREEISEKNLYDSLPSEPPDIANWFSSYVYESPVLDASDVLEFSVPGESECVQETQAEEETAKTSRNGVCPRLFEKDLVSSAKVTDFSQSQSVLSEPPDVRNWFASYEYQSPQLSDSHELGFSSFEKDQLIIHESDTEEENRSSVFRKTRNKQETISPGRLRSNDCKGNIAADTVKEVSSYNAYSEQEMEMKSSVGLFNASTKEVKQESSFKRELLFCETKHEASLQELRPTHIQETNSMNSSRERSPRKASSTACQEENLELVDQESNDKENVHGKSNETGFVTTKKARFRDSRDRWSMKKPNRGVLVECSRAKELKKIAREEEEEEEEERKKKRRVLGDMSNHQFSGAEEIAGKWRCPQKNKGKSGPALKQLRLDAWMHKV